jgi:hypothetical protein
LKRNLNRILHGELVLLVGILVAELVVDGSEPLAVSTPRSVELGQNILGIVKDDLVELASDQGEDGGVVGFGNGVGLEHRLQGTREVRFDKGGDRCGGEFGGLVMRVLEGVGHVIDDKRGPLSLEEV